MRYCLNCQTEFPEDEDFSCPKAEAYNDNNVGLYIPTKEEIADKINTALTKLENIADRLSGFGIGLGWTGLLLPIIKEICKYNKENNGDIEISQIKEKYGTLRIYLSYTPDYISEMIEKAEEESSHICEECGARGETQEVSGWLKTLCDEHFKIWQKESEERLKV